MTYTHLRQLALGLIAALVFLCITRQAAAINVVITTNMGGADAEVRESQTNTGLDGVPVGANRGNNTELATRLLDDVSFDDPEDPNSITQHFRTNDRSAVMYTKFDLANNLPASLLDPNHSFWSNGRVVFRMHVRNGPGNFNNLFGDNPSDPNEPPEVVNLRFRVHGLDPFGTYIEDDPGAADRTDRLGNNYTSDQYRYDWNEGDSSAGSGITYYNAPGIQPHCMLSGECADGSIPNSDASSVVQTLGIYDDFDANVRDLGTIEPLDFLDPEVSTSGLPLGGAIDFTGTALRDLVVDALMAGREHVTLMVHIDNDGTFHRPGLNRSSDTPTAMLNRNYLLVPKDCGDPNASGGACDALFADNHLTGEFSPKLMFVPEPSSMILVGLGMLVAALFRRRA